MATLGNPGNTIEVLQKYKFNFQKKFGQNFLIDTHVLDKIIRESGVTKDDLVIEIGPGIGTMTQYLCENAREVVAIEIDKMLIPILQDTLSAYDNVTIINEDVLKYNFTKKADLIVCEMLDTALIDEEEVQVLNHARKFLKDDGEIIPKAIINFAELVHMQRYYLHWDENVKYENYSNIIIRGNLYPSLSSWKTFLFSVFSWSENKSKLYNTCLFSISLKSTNTSR